MTRSARWRVGALATLVLLTSGCAAVAPPPYAELAEPQTADDQYPGALPDGIAAESVRLVGEIDGRSFYLAQPATDEFTDGVCILVDGPDIPADSGAGCAEASVETTRSFGSVRYHGDRIPDSAMRDGWERVSDNLMFRASPPPYTELVNEQSDDDLLPLGITQAKDIDDRSSRYVGEFEGARFYLATATSAGGNDQVCILWSRTDRFGDGVGCAMREFRRVWPELGTARYSPTPVAVSAVPDGWHRISDNLLFEPAPPVM